MGPAAPRARPAAEDDLPPSRWPLFVTLGRRRRDGSYTRLGHQATHDVAQDLLARLGARAEIPEDLRHPHVLRHTFATRYYRDTHDPAGPQSLLGHADPKTTMIYVDDTPADRERLMLRASDEPTQSDIDRAAYPSRSPPLSANTSPFPPSRAVLLLHKQ